MTDIETLTGEAYTRAVRAGHRKYLRNNRARFRSTILQLVGQMAGEFPGADWSFARERFSLIGKVKELTGSPDFLTALTGVGLSREQIRDEYAFAQDDIARNAAKAA